MGLFYKYITMKILYGIQGTGNGHLSRGDFIYSLLKKHFNHVDVLISGDNYSLSPKMPIKYKNKGVTFSISKVLVTAIICGEIFSCFATTTSLILFLIKFNLFKVSCINYYQNYLFF